MYKKSRVLSKIRENMKKGGGLVNSCISAGVDPSTVWGWRKKWRRINIYIETILEARVQLVEDALYKEALKGNTTAQIFFLTNRAKDRWIHKNNVDHTGLPAMNTTINVTPQKTIVFTDIKAIENADDGTENLHADKGTPSNRIEQKV